MKKIVSILLILAMTLSLVSIAAAEDEIPAYDGSEVTITFYHSMGALPQGVLQEYIPEFNKIYPNIKVVESKEGNDYNDLRNKITRDLTTMPVSTEPDLAYCYPDHVALYRLTGKVAVLDDFINSTATVTRADGTTEIMGFTDEQKADFIEAYYNEGRQFGDGKMYTLPMSKSTEVLYYNKTFFEANNLSVPTTWDEMEVLLKKIVEIDPFSIPLGYDSEANWFITMTEQLKSGYTTVDAENPADYFLFNNPENIAFVKRFREWYQELYMTTAGLFGKYTSNLFVVTDPNPETTRAYMSIGSSAGATHQRPTANADGTYPFEVGIAPIPQADPNNRKVISQGPSVVMFKKDNPQEMAATWLFMKYLVSNVEFQAAFASEQGYVPVLKSVREYEDYADFLASADGGDNIAALSAIYCMDQQADYYTSPAFVGSSTARDVVGDLMITCFNVKDGDTVDAEIEEAFAQALKKCINSVD